jgi:hypothetical protein
MKLTPQELADRLSYTSKPKIRKFEFGGSIDDNPLKLRNFDQVSESTYVQPAINKLERDLELAEIRESKIKQREKELTEHYNKPNMVSGMKRKPTTPEITQQATASVDYNEQLRNDPVGTLGPDIAMALIPEAMFLKTPQQLISKGISKVNPFKTKTPWTENINKTLTQEQAIQARAERMLSQQDKWIGQSDDVVERFKNANKNHNPASDYSPEKLGRNYGAGTEISKGANLSEVNKARIAAHETGHYYKNSPIEGDEWNSFFDFSQLSPKTRKYLKGKSMYADNPIGKPGIQLSRGVQVNRGQGNEIRERAAQLKDYIATKNNIPLNKDFIIKESQLNDAIKNYVKDTNLDNSMSKMLNSLTDKKGFLNAMNKYALAGAIPATIGTSLLKDKSK